MPKTETGIKIDKGIPFPGDSPVGRRSIYPWLQMAVGDSFAFNGSLVNAKAAATYYTAKGNKTFKARALNGGVRVWRTK